MKYILILLLSSSLLFSEDWIDTTYSFNLESDIVYSVETDFAGKERQLLLDIRTPLGDSPPNCGRPLAVVVHGGAWLAGSKEDPNIKRMSEDFAKRGYVTANINYRLGMFHTDKNIHCNVEGWDCFNVTDSAEWYRAYFRAVQDVNTAIRYLLINRKKYNINPNNVFLIGESAGAYTVIGTGYIDSELEVLTEYTQEQLDAPSPNSIYESPCIQELGIAESIESMNLERPDLGGYKGSRYLDTELEYDIKAVGAFYGGVFKNIFTNIDASKPALYMFHQPNDLIVPMNFNKILQGFASCARGFPLNCQDIISRLYTWGSGGVNAMLDSISDISLNNIDYVFEKSNNNAPCVEQVANPSRGGHQFDNYWLRTNELSEFFATKIEDCETETNIENNRISHKLKIYPNPIINNSIATIYSKPGILKVFDVYGNQMLSENTDGYFKLSENLIKLTNGVYFIKVSSSNYSQTGKIIVQN